MSTNKRGRGRPTKAEQAEAEKALELKLAAEEIPVPPKTVHQHLSKLRCVAANPSYPMFMGKPCGQVMKAKGTTHGGKYKQWVCPVCRATSTTTAKEI